MAVGAEIVIGERTDDVALPDRAVVTLRGDAGKLCLQPLQAGDALAHAGQMLPGDAVRLGARFFRMLRELDQIAYRAMPSPRSRAWRMKARRSRSARA
jgi:hypothetical protein